MATRPTWQGHLRLSLVSCPVALYTATSATGEVHFNLLHKETMNRIRMIPTDPETGPVERADLVKGFEVDKGRYVVITDDEIKAVRLESTRTIDIERFVDATEIDRLYWNNPYYLVPDGKIAAEAFAVIREAMSQSGKLALGRVVLHQRERLMALEPRDEGIVAYSLRTYDEVRQPKDYFDAIPAAKPDAKMIDIARKIIEQLEGPFDPTQFDDRYALAVLDRAMVMPDGVEVRLPFAFGTTVETVPADVPYVHVSPRARERWGARLGAGRDRIRVGLAWSGNPAQATDRYRSMPFEALRPLLDVDAAFYSLQVNYRDGELAALEADGRITSFHSEISDFMDTAALIEQLDLVVAVDTSAAHLTVALGKTMWLMLAHRPDYRWHNGREDSPWYPTARLFLQSEQGDWTSVIDRIRIQLSEVIGAAPR